MPPVMSKRSLADGRHLMRFLKSQAGTDAATIAKQENVSIATIKQSIAQMEMYRKRNTQVEFELAIRDLVISSVPQAKETLHGLLTAMELVEIKDAKTGRVKYERVEDKTTRIEAVRLTKELIVGLQPKTPQVVNNLNQTNQVANLNDGIETNEERMRRLRAQIKEHNLLPAEVAGVPQHIDRDEEDPDGDEEEDDDTEPEEDGDE